METATMVLCDVSIAWTWHICHDCSGLVAIV